MKSGARYLLAVSALGLFLGLFVTGCAKQAVVVPPQVASPPPAPVRQREAPNPTPAPAPAPAPTAMLQAGDFKDVSFDFDKYDLSDAARAALDVDARLLRDNATARILIEGHCDERGTEEYNQALGERRADAARDYLVAAGVSAARIQTISYGKERPFCTEHDESCWARNRCGHVGLQPHPA